MSDDKKDVLDELLKLAEMNKEVSPQQNEAERFIMHFNIEPASPEECIRNNETGLVMLYVKYVDWCKQNKQDYITKSIFSSQLNKIFPRKKYGNNGESCVFYVKDRDNHFDVEYGYYLRYLNKARKYDAQRRRINKNATKKKSTKSKTRTI